MFNPYIYIQYLNSPRFVNLVTAMSESLLFETQDFTADYLNIMTAITKGLDNWGIILNQPRAVRSGLAYNSVFGFDNGVPPGNTVSYPQNLFYSNFFNASYSPPVYLNNTQYRALLKMIYRKYTTNNSIYDLNNIIQEYAINMSHPGIPYVFDTYDMQITYKFPYVLQTYEAYLFQNTRTLAKPAGVKLNLELEE